MLGLDSRPMRSAVRLAKGRLSMGMLGVPLMALVISPVQAAGILPPIYVVSGYRRADRVSAQLRPPVLVSLIPGMLAGMALGWATARLVNEAQVGLIVGLIGLAFSANAIPAPGTGGACGARSLGCGHFWGRCRAVPVSCRIPVRRPIRSMSSPCRCRPMLFAGTTTIFSPSPMRSSWCPMPRWASFRAEPDDLGGSCWRCRRCGVVGGAGWIIRRVPATYFSNFITWALVVVSAK